MDTPRAADTPSEDGLPLHDADLEQVVGGVGWRHFDHIGNIKSTPTPPPTGAFNGAVPRTAPATPFFDDMMEGSNI